MNESRVACFPASLSSLARRRGLLGALRSLVLFEQLELLLDAIRSGAVTATVVIVDASTFEQVVAAVRRIRTSFSAHPIVAYYYAQGMGQRQLLVLAQLGVADLVQVGMDDSRAVFENILESATCVSHAQVLAERLKPDIPASIRNVFTFALEHAGRRMDVPELAASLGISKRTLAWRLQQHGLPSPRVLLTWCRLLVAAQLLQERGRTLDSVADQLNFPGGHTLGAVFFRYMGRGINSLRDEGVVDEVIAEFRLEITASRASLPLT